MWLIALMAASLFSIIVSSRRSIASLVDSPVSVGINFVSYPRRIWLGNNLVIAFCLLLWIVVVIDIQSVQASGDIKVANRRYCSTHWFFRSDRPSVWGWNAVDRFCSMPSLWANDLPKCDVNLRLRSLIIFMGRPYYLYTWSMYNCVIPSPVIFVVHGRNTAALEQPWSTMVRIASLPLCVGSSVIRSIATCWNGRASSVVLIQNGGTFALWVCILFCWHVAHPFMYSMIQSFMPFQVVIIHVFWIVSSLPGCPAAGWSCIRSMMALFISVVMGCSEVIVAALYFSGGMTICCWLSFFPWLTPGGWESASGGMFSLPGMCCIS